MPGPRSHSGLVDWKGAAQLASASKPFHLGPGIRRDERIYFFFFLLEPLAVAFEPFDATALPFAPFLPLAPLPWAVVALPLPAFLAAAAHLASAAFRALPVLPLVEQAGP